MHEIERCVRQCVFRDVVPADFEVGVESLSRNADLDRSPRPVLRDRPDHRANSQCFLHRRRLRGTSNPSRRRSRRGGIPSLDRRSPQAPKTARWPERRSCRTHRRALVRRAPMPLRPFSRTWRVFRSGLRVWSALLWVNSYSALIPADTTTFRHCSVSRFRNNAVSTGEPPTASRAIHRAACRYQEAEDSLIARELVRDTGQVLGARQSRTR